MLTVCLGFFFLVRLLRAPTGQVTGATNRKELKKVLKKRDASYSELLQRLERVSSGRAPRAPPHDIPWFVLRCRQPASSSRILAGRQGQRFRSCRVFF